MYVTLYQLNTYVPAVRLKIACYSDTILLTGRNLPASLFLSYCFIDRYILRSRGRDVPGQLYRS
jgi:hypothetical protein